MARCGIFQCRGRKRDNRFIVDGGTAFVCGKKICAFRLLAAGISWNRRRSCAVGDSADGCACPPDYAIGRGCGHIDLQFAAHHAGRRGNRRAHLRRREPDFRCRNTVRCRRNGGIRAPAAGTFPSRREKRQLQLTPRTSGVVEWKIHFPSASVPESDCENSPHSQSAGTPRR